MPTIAMRNLGPNRDPLYGGGFNNFLYDLDAVAQLIQTRLLLFEGEWWQDLTDGLPLFQSILGVAGAGKNSAAVSQLIQKRILGTPFVESLSDVQTSYQPTQRTFVFQCFVQTTFGTLQVNIGPGTAAVISAL